MEHYGFVRLHRGQRGRIRPEVPSQSISLELPLSAWTGVAGLVSRPKPDVKSLTKACASPPKLQQENAHHRRLAANSVAAHKSRAAGRDKGFLSPQEEAELTELVGRSR